MMLLKFCPKCGKKTTELYDGLCLDCFLEKMKVDWLPASIVVDKCKHCNYFYVGKKRYRNLTTLLHKKFKNLLKKKNAQLLEIYVKENTVKISFTLSKSGVEKRVTKSLPLKFHYITCPYCTMMRSGYHNAVLQVQLPPSIKDDVIKLIQQKVGEFNRRDPMAFIAEIKDTGKA